MNSKIFLLSWTFVVVFIDADLRKLHLHVGENMEEADHGVPQPTVCQTLLVSSAGTLKNKLCKCANTFLFLFFYFPSLNSLPWQSVHIFSNHSNVIRI